MELINQIINDTLKSPDGKWSRKSLTMFSAWIMAILSGIFILISDFFFIREINQYAVDIFYGFLLLAGGTSIMTVWDKIRNRVNSKEEQDA